MSFMLEVLRSTYNSSKRCVNIPCFISNPGIGKTSIIKQFAKEVKVRCVIETASTKAPHEFGGMAVPDYENKVMTIFNYDKLKNMKDGEILFLDELPNAPIQTLNAFLSILMDRMLPDGTPLANIMIVAAGNYGSVNSWTSQIKQRFHFYDVEFNKKSWKEYIENIHPEYSIYCPTEWTITFNQLSDLIKNEKFNNTTNKADSNNFYTPRSILDAVESMIEGVITPYEKILDAFLGKIIKNNSGYELTFPNFTIIPKNNKKIPNFNFVLKNNESIKWIDLQKKLYNEINNKSKV